jgi:hypothetical protein
MARQTRREFLYRSLGSLSAVALGSAAAANAHGQDAEHEVSCLADLAATGHVRPTLEACTRDDAGGISC